jgi:hypothetical protein
VILSILLINESQLNSPFNHQPKPTPENNKMADVDVKPEEETKMVQDEGDEEVRVGSFFTLVPSGCR